MKTKPPAGTLVKLTGDFLRNTGQQASSEGKRRWTVLECTCGLCRSGRHVAVDQRLPPEMQAGEWRHFAFANLQPVGKGLGTFPDDYNIEFRVHEGQPSWHQRRAGHRSAGVTTGFKTREAAEEFAAKLRKNSGVSAWIEEVHSEKGLGDLPRWMK